MDDGTEAYPNLIANACYKDPKMEGKMDGPLLRKMLVRSLFEVASQPETRDSNRRKMYALWKESNQDDDDDE
jgi:ribosomal RNA-processing protein 1